MSLNLLRKSVMLQKQADKVIRDTEIIEIFKKIGTVNFVGSYELGLMMRKDIDMIVINSKPIRHKADLITEILKASKKFSSVRLIDSYTKRLAFLPKGYYWELKVRRPEGEWKFDIWYLTSKDDESIAPTKKWKSLLTPEKIDLILEVKNKYLRTKMLYSHNLYGAKIYKAILDMNINSLETFHKRIALPTKRKINPNISVNKSGK